MPRRLNNPVLVTHVQPHVDDVVGMWLYQRYRPGWKKARIVMLPLEAQVKPTYLGEPVDSNPKVVHIGMAGGMFDEHHLKRKATATQLVWEWLLKKGYIPAKDKPALQKIVDYVYLEDTGENKNKPLEDRMVSFSAIYNGLQKDRLTVGYNMLEGLLRSMRSLVELEKAWKTRKEFQTKWGKGVAFKTAVAGGDAYAYGKGFVIVAQINPQHNYRSIKGRAGSKVNLTGVFKEVTKREPDVGWYLHQSKKLLLAGSSSAPNVKKSNLTLNELIALIPKK